MKKVQIFCTIVFMLISTISYSQFTSLLNFAGTTNGQNPKGSLISDGTFLYGMTELGGANNLGTVFKIMPDGTGYVKLLDFDGDNKGANPTGSLYFDGIYLYGMTSAGGYSVTYGERGGTIFKIKPDGTGFVKLLIFREGFTLGYYGFSPKGSLISDGTFLYGMTEDAGEFNAGIVFKIKKDGTNFVILKSFLTQSEGKPNGSLFFDGTFLYGLTAGGTGSSGGGGHVFKIKPDGTSYTILKSFLWDINGKHMDGEKPHGSLISDGTYLYGMTERGGTVDRGTIFKIKPDGSGFVKILDFNSFSVGANQPFGSLFFDGSTYLYGMTTRGSAGDRGTIFKIKRDGTSYYNMYDSTILNKPEGDLISDGTFLYGMSRLGDGSLGYLGNVFKYQYCNIAIPIVSNNGSICIGNTLSLTASTIVGATYSWTGPNGFNSTLQNPTVSTNTTTVMGGTYSCVARVDGCSSQAGTTNVIVNQATAGNNGPVCVGNTLSLTASAIPGATYFWSGPNGFSSTVQNPTVSLSAISLMAGVYSVYTTANGCNNSVPGTTTVAVNSIPSTPTSGNNGPVCIGKTLSLTASTVAGATYSWTGPNSFISNLQNPTVSTSATSTMGGVYRVIATVNGCPSVAGVTAVEINKITASNNGPVCVSNTVSLSATTITGAAYNWTGPNGFTSSQQNPIVSTNATLAMAGVYSVISTVNGCASAASVTIVSINPAIATPTVTSLVTYCQNATSTPLNATGSNLLWYSTSTGGTGSSITPTPSTTASGTTSYYVSQTIGCESPRVSISVVVNPLPVAAGTINGTATVCQGQNAVTYTIPTITNATSYVWTLPTGATGTSTTNSITVNYSVSAVSENITVKGTNTCGIGTYSVLPINIISTPAPIGNSLQNLIQGQTLSNIQVTGTGIVWYASLIDATNQSNPLQNTTLLVNGTTYYANQTVNGCTSGNSLAVTVAVTLGTNTFENGNFKFYPNPVENVFNFECDKNITSLRLVNMSGQVVIKKKLNQTSGQVDIGSLPSGSYILKLTTESGESTVKLIKK